MAKTKTKLRLVDSTPDYPPEIDLKEIGSRLKEVREKLEMSQVELCKKIGLGTTTWNNWELGRRLPSVEYMIKLRRFIPISLDRIYFGSN